MDQMSFHRLNKPRWFYVSVVLVVVVIGAFTASQLTSGREASGGVGPEVGQIAPDFSVRAVDGRMVRLRDFDGKRIVLNFFATWCAPCKAEAAHLKAAYERKSSDVDFIGVTFQDTTRSVQVFAEEYGIPFTLALDDSGEMGKAYGVRGFPTTFFIRADGVIHYVVKGAMTKELIELILEGMPQP